MLPARASGRVAVGDAVEAFVRPEVASLARDAAELPADLPRYQRPRRTACCSTAPIRPCCCAKPAASTEFRIALPQTGRFADLRVGETVAFGFDPQRAVCFAAPA